jgi:hypothetical protein
MARLPLSRIKDAESLIELHEQLLFRRAYPRDQRELHQSKLN